jgi:peptidyl-prolyl cis-trans isomerase D
MAVGLLGDAIKSGFIQASDNMVNDLATFEKEQRSIEFISFPDKDFKNTKAPNEAELKNMYEATKEAYANPELREGQIIIINTKNLKSTIEITEEDLREAYDRDIDSYSEPETRTVEAALLDTLEKAQKIAEAVKTGKSLKDATKEITGNTTDYLPPKKFSEKEIDESIKAEVFNAKAGDMIGPLETALGPQVLVLKNINEPKVQSFENIKADIRQDMEETKLSDAQFDLANNLDDALASGTNADDIKKQFDVEVTTLAPMSTMGTDASGKPAFGKFKDIGDKILQSLFELDEGEASAIFETPDGGMAALILKSITSKTYKPFEEIKDAMLKQWTDTTRQTDNKVATLKILADMNTEKLNMKDIAAKYKKQTQSVAGILRTKAPAAPLNAGSLGSIFEAKEGDIIALDIQGGAAIARITKVNIEGTYSKEEMEKARPNIVNSLQNESYDIYLEQARKRFGAHINDELLAKIYETKQEE